MWKSDSNGKSLSFILTEAPNYEQNIQMLKPNAELIWTTEAENYNEAHQKYYDYMGWGKYKPIDE